MTRPQDMRPAASLARASPPVEGSGLQIEGLEVHAGAFCLADLNLEIAAGEYLVLLGPTGAGKTMLLETLAGLRSPDAGRARWRGEDVTALEPERRPFAVLFSRLGLFPHLSVLGNITYGPRVAGVDRATREALARRLADQMGISHLLERSVAGLSSGEGQRVALARALAVEPEVLLLDEPLSALDRATRGRLMDLLRGVHEETGVTVLHVTHDQEVALALADRVAVLLEGRLHPPRPAEDLYRLPEELAVARFLGLRNLLVTECEEGRARLPGLTLRSPAIPGGAVALWIPPDRVELTPPPEAAPDTVSPAWTGPARLEALRLLGPVAEARLRIGQAPDRPGGSPETDLAIHAHLAPSRLTRLRPVVGHDVQVTIPAEAVHPLLR